MKLDCYVIVSALVTSYIYNLLRHHLYYIMDDPMAILKSSLSQNQGQASPKREDRRFEGWDPWTAKYTHA